jgi:hypothetical protein
MSNISISNLDLTGSELFIDSETFMNELSDRELEISGGFPSPPILPDSRVIDPPKSLPPNSFPVLTIPTPQ